MRFMMMVKTSEAAGPPSPALEAAIGKLMGEMAATGVLVDAGGLLPSAKGATLRLSRAQVTVTDGPFLETKELVGGFAVLEAASKEDAVELGRRFLQVHADTLGASYEATLEIRQMADQPARTPEKATV